jgi:hypothetical protein
MVLSWFIDFYVGHVLIDVVQVVLMLVSIFLTFFELVQAGLSFLNMNHAWPALVHVSLSISDLNQAWPTIIHDGSSQISIFSSF